MMTNHVSTIELMDDSKLSDSEKVEKYCVSLCKKLQRNYDICGDDV